MSILKRFSELFKGLDRAYVRIPIKDVEVQDGQKVEAYAYTMHEPVTESVYQKHLSGDDNIGIIPIMDNSKVNFGAIDIDNYNLNFTELDEKIRKLNLPLLACRSKSGGAHLYMFLEHPMSGKFVVAKLKSFALALGYSYEIFPKQVKLASKKDVGNSITIPYHKGDETTRFCYFDGKRLTLEAFLRKANDMKVSKEYLADFEIESDGDFKDCPPCIQMLAQSGIPSGYRNDTLFSFGVLAKRKFGDGWKEMMEEYNQNYFSPPLPAAEILTLQKSLSKNQDYFYKCSQAPLIHYCNKDECRKREFGIGNGDEIPVTIEKLVKYTTDPPIYVVQIDGQRIEMNTNQLMEAGYFRKRVFETMNVLLPRLKPKQWDVEIARLLEEIEIRYAPQSSTPVGKMIEHLEAYCMMRPSDDKDVLLKNGVWIDDDYIYFRGPAFEEYLQKKKFFELKSSQITAALREQLNAKHYQTTIKGKCVTYWQIDRFPEQDVDFETKRVVEEF